MEKTFKLIHLITFFLCALSLYWALLDLIESELPSIYIKLILYPIGLINGYFVTKTQLLKKFGTTSFKGFGKFDRIVASFAILLVFAVASALSILLAPFIVSELIVNALFKPKEAPHEKLDQ